jgi:capsular polysaccharide biosynthesis protein
MELREYYKILKLNMSVIFYTILISIVVVYAWSMKQSETYSASVLLNISRMETQSSADYRYDQFYRVQADEKFAETIGEWLKMPGIASEIMTKANINQVGKTVRTLSKSFQSDKMAPEIVEVRYSTTNQDDAKKISDALGGVITEKIKSLNSEAKDPNWFSVTPSNLVILRNVQDLKINLSLAIVVGLFFGVLFALAKYYTSEERV